MRVYLNGPVDEVRGAVSMTVQRAKKLRALGHTVCVGRELWLGNLPTTKRYRMAVQLLMRCDAIYNMVGCELSWPAMQIHRVAMLAGIEALAVNSGQLAVGSGEDMKAEAEGTKIVCDECGWTQACNFEDVPTWHRKPCPDCGKGEIVSDEDLIIFRVAEAAMNVTNEIDPDGKMPRVELHLDTAKFRSNSPLCGKSAGKDGAE